MLFNSVEFLVFFPIVLLVYFIIPKKVKLYWLLLASYYFYMCWNARYALLIFSSTLITYGSGLLLEGIKRTELRRPDRKSIYMRSIVAISFSLNLIILFYFKYINFALETLQSFLGHFNIQLSLPAFDIILPVGISFYTFQALSYTMDVYRDEIYAEKNFFRYALFVSFFPQLVAGPIERSKNLLRQLSTPAKFDFESAREGFLLMLWGYFLKIVFADRAAIFVEIVYGDISRFSGVYLVIATIIFAMQIYCDFYGYSVIAMGAAKIIGIQLMENFDAPYISTSVAGFWRRWHISLTSWFKDYLYIPLGGSRKGQTRKYLNKLLVFLVSGLWHGADLSYMVWGGLNGLYQICGDILRPARDRLITLFQFNRQSLGHKIFSCLLTFILVDFSWIFFRAEGMKEAFEIIHSIATVHNPWILFDGSLYQCGLDYKNWNLLLISLIILIFSDFCKYKGIVIRKVIIQQDFWFRWIFIVLSICGILIFGVWGSGYNKANFIYFQF